MCNLVESGVVYFTCIYLMSVVYKFRAEVDAGDIRAEPTAWSAYYLFQL